MGFLLRHSGKKNQVLTAMQNSDFKNFEKNSFFELPLIENLFNLLHYTEKTLTPKQEQSLWIQYYSTGSKEAWNVLVGSYRASILLLIRQFSGQGLTGLQLLTIALQILNDPKQHWPVYDEVVWEMKQAMLKAVSAHRKSAEVVE